MFWAAAVLAYSSLVERFQIVFGIWESAQLPSLARLRSWGDTYLQYSLDFPEAFRMVMAGRERTVAAHAAARADLEHLAAATGMGPRLAELAALDQAMRRTRSVGFPLATTGDPDLATRGFSWPTDSSKRARRQPPLPRLGSASTMARSRQLVAGAPSSRPLRCAPSTPLV